MTALRRRSTWLAVVTIVIAAVFTHSCVRGVLVMRTASGHTHGVALTRGAVYVIGANEPRPWFSSPPPGGPPRDAEWLVNWNYRLGLWSVAFVPEWQTTGGAVPGPQTWWFALPFWPVLVCLPIWTALAWRKERKLARELGRRCVCGYDLSLIAAPVCPECGRPITTAPATNT